MSEKKDDIRSVVHSVKRLVHLYIENLKIATTEKGIVLFSGAVVAMLALLLCACAFFFCSFAIVLILGTVLPLMWCYLIMGGFYLLMAVVVIMLRKPLIENPIARYISRVVIDEPVVPNTPNPDKQASTYEQQQ